jgi:hypothetical protein
MIGIWRKLRPERRQFAYRGNQETNPKSRLDRIYIPENWLRQIISAQICPYFADHARILSNILPPTKPHRAAFWRFRNTPLKKKYFTDFVTTIIQYYSASDIESENILGLWDEMKEEIRLQAQIYDDQRRQKKKQYIELEQQISYLRKVNSPKLKRSLKYSRHNIAKQISTRCQTTYTALLQLKPTPIPIFPC